MVRTFVASGLVLASGALALAGGCTVDTTSTRGDAGAYEAPGEAAAPACGDCLALECTATLAACLTDPACRAIHLSGCGAAAGAPADGGDPRAAFDALAACASARATTACSAECANAATPPACGASDAGPSDAAALPDAAPDAAPDAGDDGGATGAPAPPPSADACTSCAAAACGDAKKLCALGTECAAYLACVYAAADAPTADACGRAHATGRAAALELSSCTRAGCSQECGF